MIVTFTVNTETEDSADMTINRLAKADDMANMLWQLYHNFWREWKHDESKLNLDNMRKSLQELFDEYNINVDDLTM